ncbi:MAG: 39S ribosomal protein L14, mitochondrial [Marteilia pararefringens]
MNSSCQIFKNFLGPQSINHLWKRTQVQKQTILRPVDNSHLATRCIQEMKKVRCIHVYRKRKYAFVGDLILVTILGRMCKAIVVNTRQYSTQGVPRADSNQCVLVDKELKPLGNRISSPIPSVLRRFKQCEQLCSLPNITFVA